MPVKGLEYAIFDTYHLLEEFGHSLTLWARLSSLLIDEECAMRHSDLLIND
jgi:hypothetical protein